MSLEFYDVLVVGDEVESILTAVSAAKAGARTALLRRSEGWLGGLSTRGGLSYMDITPEYCSPLFSEFLQQAGVVRVALNPERADAVLRDLLKQAGVTVASGIVVEQAEYDNGWRLSALESGVHVPYAARVMIDATPDADVARLLGIPYLMGLGGVLGERQNYLGISPVFRIEGVPVAEMQAFEARLRERPDIQAVLEQALPFHPPELRAEYVTRPTYAPEEMDYLDILNPTIGVYYHLWRHGDATTYPHAPIVIDGGNVSRLSDGSLGFNGLVCRLDRLMPEASETELFDALLDYSQGAPVPDFLLEEMQAFERFLREEGGLSEACVTPPQELYVRQTLTLLSRQNMTAEHILRGGVESERAVGTFSYWLDLRGAELWQVFPGEKLPKPVFNVGLDVALPAWPRLENFAFVSRSAGYSPIGQGTGRIVQHNSLLGEALGVVAALSALSGNSLEITAEQGLSQVRDILAHRQGAPLNITGHATWSDAEIANSQLLRADNLATARLREQVAEGLPLL